MVRYRREFKETDLLSTALNISGCNTLRCVFKVEEFVLLALAPINFLAESGVEDLDLLKLAMNMSEI